MHLFVENHNKSTSSIIFIFKYDLTKKYNRGGGINKVFLTKYLPMHSKGQKTNEN